MPAVKDDILLMQHADGELEQLEVDDDARVKLDALHEMRELVAGNLEASADAVPDHKFAAMWREVDKAIAEKAQDDAPKGIFGAIAAWIDRHRGHVITGMVSAGAVAAIALVMRPGASERGIL